MPHTTKASVNPPTPSRFWWASWSATVWDALDPGPAVDVQPFLGRGPVPPTRSSAAGPCGPRRTHSAQSLTAPAAAPLTPERLRSSAITCNHRSTLPNSRTARRSS